MSKRKIKIAPLTQAQQIEHVFQEINRCSASISAQIGDFHDHIMLELLKVGAHKVSSNNSDIERIAEFLRLAQQSLDGITKIRCTPPAPLIIVPG
jgi:uncharacterized protein YdaL